jgi:hypothetical protein
MTDAVTARIVSARVCDARTLLSRAVVFLPPGDAKDQVMLAWTACGDALDALDKPEERKAS